MRRQRAITVKLCFSCFIPTSPWPVFQPFKLLYFVYLMPLFVNIYIDISTFHFCCRNSAHCMKIMSIFLYYLEIFPTFSSTLCILKISAFFPISNFEKADRSIFARLSVGWCHHQFSFSK